LSEKKLKRIYELPYVMNQRINWGIYERIESTQACPTSVRWRSEIVWGTIIITRYNNKARSKYYTSVGDIKRTTELPSLKEIKDYLHKRCQVLEAVESWKGKIEMNLYSIVLVYLVHIIILS